MEDIQKIEEEKRKLREVYDTIADSYSNLRVRPTVYAKEFSTEAKGLVIDLGCGNCRNLIPFLEKNMNCVGMDYSKGMIREAIKNLQRRNLKVHLILGDVVSPPFKDNVFDMVLSKALLHHIPSKKLRLKSLKNLKDICKKDCNLLFSVWSYTPSNFLDFLLNLFKKKIELGDVYKKWKYHGKVYKRFYHLYRSNELKNELKKTGFKIKRIYHHKGNIVAFCET